MSLPCLRPLMYPKPFRQMSEDKPKMMMQHSRLWLPFLIDQIILLGVRPLRITHSHPETHSLSPVP